jgi:hypothetical protein
MSIGDWFRRLFSSGGETSEEETALHEEYGTPDEAESDLHGMEELSGGAVMPGRAASEGAEAAEADLASEEAPPDPNP